ncbi:hypothetical protein SeMB42_g04264 [Synchytrium endobioticum]|uniref:Uncharacterized protein n=1 Tax=Synchytrium endobioticum TaxID=286115 RepID=A0A507CZN0_9FUNG|nr:hypothetical protein SeMB42_g04264 [Synchytrium endobioticum]
MNALPKLDHMSPRSSLGARSGTKTAKKMDENTNTLNLHHRVVKDSHVGNDGDVGTGKRSVKPDRMKTAALTHPVMISHRLLRKSGLPTPTPHPNRIMVAPAAEPIATPSAERLNSFNRKKKASVLDRLSSTQIHTLETAVMNASPDKMIGFVKLNGYEQEADKENLVLGRARVERLARRCENPRNRDLRDLEDKFEVHEDTKIEAEPLRCEIGFKVLFRIGLLTMLVMATMVVLHWLYTVGLDLQHCPGRPTMMDYRNPLTNILPACITCEPDTVCKGKAVTGCYHGGDILESSALAEYFPYTTWPLPLGRPSCIDYNQAVWNEAGPSKVARVLRGTKARVWNHWNHVHDAMNDYGASVWDVISQPETYTIDNMIYTISEARNHYQLLFGCVVAAFGSLAIYRRCIGIAVSKRLAAQTAKR